MMIYYIYTLCKTGYGVLEYKDYSSIDTDCTQIALVVVLGRRNNTVNKLTSPCQCQQRNYAR